MIAWVTHHVERNLEAQWALPDGVGGAEMTDAAMIDKRPDGETVVIVQPSAWQHAMDADRVIVTGTDLLTAEAMRALAQRRPVVWVHHQQTPSEARRVLIEAAQPFAAMSALHARVESAWCGVDATWCHGWLDPAETVTAPAREDAALWAARNHPQKGRIDARIWAQRNGVPLTEITDAPRADVLAAMAAHRWFVFLPKGLDACPRTLIEAELAGCEIVTNDLAGRRDPGDLLDVLAEQPVKFWGWL